MIRPCRCVTQKLLRGRAFSASASNREIRDIGELQNRIHPTYSETSRHDLLCLQWPSPPRNILLVRKEEAPDVNAALVEFANHIHATYPSLSLIFEPHVAKELCNAFDFPIFTTGHSQHAPKSALQDKVDLTSTLGGDGTILHASSLFAKVDRVPPILSFSMGTLGFLGEWKFNEHKRAFRELYMSGASAGYGSSLLQAEAQETESKMTKAPQPQNMSSAWGLGVPEKATSAALSETERATSISPDRAMPSSRPTGWSSIRGKSMGQSRGSRVLLRNRLKVGLFAPDGSRIPSSVSETSSASSALAAGEQQSDVYAMNEVLLHRGRTPHLSIIDIFVGGRFLTEAVADGMIISTPTGSTAYSLSSGGSIVHPLVSSLLLTPICPRSLSFRPLVLPANTPITLRLSKKNRGREIEVSIDGVRRDQGLSVGMEVRVVGEDIKARNNEWIGGVPSVVRGANGGGGGEEGNDHWVGGLNGLLKFNYPFGEG
ncbi:NADH kinase pos5 [Elasticomyces elasticus]|nr:NADH kinase pos5 [Elasticomyces elasticus]